MSSYVDIHSHILPQIDDGAKNEDMSFKMFHMAQRNGIAKIILTPHHKPMHHNANPQKIVELTQTLQQEIKKHGIEIELYTGNEIYFNSDILTLLEQKDVLTMANSDYVLVEFGPMDDFGYIRNGVYQILSGGYRPILAHAERYAAMGASTDCFERMIDMGCCIQINAGSIMGQFGFDTKIFTRRVLKKELVHFVARRTSSIHPQ